jgi:hypothetical protein
MPFPRTYYQLFPPKQTLLTEEEYYYYSRCRNWTVMECARLVVNDSRWSYREDAAVWRAVEAIENCIKRGCIRSNPRKIIDDIDNKNPEFIRDHGGSPEFFPVHDKKDFSTESKRNRPFHPKSSMIPNFIRDHDIFDTKIFADEVFAYPHFCYSHSQDQPVISPGEMKRGFLTMSLELDWRGDQDSLNILKKWGLAEAIPLVFGKKYLIHEHWSKQPLIKKFSRMFEVEFGQENGNQTDILVSKAEIIEFIRRKKTREWFFSKEIDIVLWVDKFFDEVIDQVANEPKTPLGEKPDKKQKNKKENGFNPPAQDWGQVTLFASRDFWLEFKVAGKTYSEAEVLALGLTKGQRSFLFKIVLGNGFFEKVTFPEIKNISQAVIRLNESLRKIFQLNQNPISYNQQAKGYKVAFKIETDSQE